MLALCSHVVDVDCFLHLMNTFVEHVTVIQILQLLLTNLVSDGLCLGLFLLVDSGKELLRQKVLFVLTCLFKLLLSWFDENLFEHHHLLIDLAVGEGLVNSFRSEILVTQLLVVQGLLFLTFEFLRSLFQLSGLRLDDLVESLNLCSTHLIVHG